MTLLLFSLFAYFTISQTEKLSEHRKSCAYQKILTNYSTPTWKPLTWILPEDKEKLLSEECEFQPRPEKLLRTKLPSGFFRNDTERFRESLRVLLRDKTADPFMLEELRKVAVKVIGEPNIRLGSLIRYAKCISNRTIQVTVQVMKPEELLIWKCEDIGRIKNNTYEFYNLSPAWMVEDEDGRTFKINLNECSQENYQKTFSYFGVRVYFCDYGAYYQANCSIHRIEKCVKTYIRPKEKHGSFSRKLPNGIAVYGTFKSLSRMGKTNNSIVKKQNNTTDPKHGFVVDSPGLYYFNFNSTTSVFN